MNLSDKIRGHITTNNIMKILLFTDFTPTEDNYRGPSALCYHLMKELQRENMVHIITTNANKVPDYIIKKSKSIFNDCFDVVPRDWWNKLFVSRKTGRFFSCFFDRNLPYLSRYKLNRKTIRFIKHFSPDLIFVYPSHLTEVCKQLVGYKVVMIGPDCCSINSFRKLKDSFVYNKGNYRHEIRAFKQQIYMENFLSKVVDKLFLVGIEDTIIFNTITQSERAVFFPHPHYKLKDKDVYFTSEKLRILISGAYDFATYTDVNKMVECMNEHPDALNGCELTFLGKGWDVIQKRLDSSIDSQIITWVNDYAEEISKYDIQIFPISMGTGTKGKVLDAFAMGLLCIGSYYAFENIAIKPGQSCLVYKDVREIIDYIKTVKSDRQKYKTMAEYGKKLIRMYHSPVLCAKILLQACIGENIGFDKNIYYSEERI